MNERYDAVVVGAGPNGLSSAIVLARAGLSVLILEAEPTPGGAARSEERTLPGFVHDTCSAIHPMALVSPFFQSLELGRFGVDWIHPPAALAHPLDDGTAVLLERSVDATAAALGEDGHSYRELVEPFVARADVLFDAILRPVLPFTKHPLLLARLGAVGMRSAASVADRFRSDAARTFFAGCAAHSFLPLEDAGSASFGLVLAIAGHAAGWPCARGGSASITKALAAIASGAGCELVTGHRVRSVGDIPDSRAVVFDLTPRQIAAIARNELPRTYLGRLGRFRYGPGVFKVDWALDGPIPWRAAAAARAGTVHLGGTYGEIAAHERAIWRGETTESPFVLVAQQSLFDDSRAPAGKQTGWAYCHVPNGSTLDMTDVIERQVERFAPGFRDRILARATMNTSQYEAHDANLIGGDISGGSNDLLQFLMRPVAAIDPYATPNPRLFIGSSSTPPGGGVHGMCGYWAGHSALRRVFGKQA